MLKIAITSIGSGIGQSIVDSCRLSNIPMSIFGMGMNPMGFGAFDCDHRLTLPTIYHPDYVDQLLTYCKEYVFDILFPGLDDELILISERIEEFNALGVAIPVSRPEFIRLCRDKGSMSREMIPYSPAFVQSFTYEYAFENSDQLPYPLIAKPNSGFASRNIFVIHSPQDLKKIDASHIIQTIAVPKQGSINRDKFLKALEEGTILQVDEISVQLLYDQHGHELGRMTTYNKLQNGVPIEIIPIEDSSVWSVVDTLLPHFIKMGLIGPLNIQGRLTDDGFKIFEMNPRFTGITGLRSLMGFNEVEAFINHYRQYETTSEPLRINYRRIGMRQVANRVVDVHRDLDLFHAIQKIHEYPKEHQGRSSILVTGANGYLGIETVHALLKSPAVGEVKVLVRNAERFLENHFFPPEVEIFDIADFLEGHLSLGLIDIVCHLAAGREIHSKNEIALSLEFTSHLMTSIAQYHVPAVINISSQAVYGLTQRPFWSEEDAILPETSYAQSKWAGELMTKSTRRINHITSHISLRLARFMGPSIAMGFDVVPHIFCKKAIVGEPIHIQGGNQKFDYIDIRDVTRAIIRLVEMPHQEWPDVLNVGSGKQISLLELVRIISKISKEKYGTELHYTIEEKDIHLEFGMNISKIKEQIGWEPSISIEQSISDLLDYLHVKMGQNDL